MAVRPDPSAVKAAPCPRNRSSGVVLDGRACTTSVQRWRVVGRLRVCFRREVLERIQIVRDFTSLVRSVHSTGRHSKVEPSGGRSIQAGNNIKYLHTRREIAETSELVQPKRVFGSGGVREFHFVVPSHRP